jgi:hypothetical protein
MTDRRLTPQFRCVAWAVREILAAQGGRGCVNKSDVARQMFSSGARRNVTRAFQRLIELGYIAHVARATDATPGRAWVYEWRDGE